MEGKFNLIGGFSYGRALLLNCFFTFSSFLMTFSPMQVPTPQNGVTGTQRLYPLVIQLDCTSWKIAAPAYASKPMEVTPERYAMAKTAYLAYVGAMFRLFDGWSGGTNGDALAKLMVDLHATETVEQYKQFWTASNIGKSTGDGKQSLECPAQRFIDQLKISSYPGIKEGQADTFIKHGRLSVINLVQCNRLASWAGLKMLVPPMDWSTRRFEFKKALQAAIKP